MSSPIQAGENVPARRLIILGSTGSIGTNTLNVVEHLHRLGCASFDVVGLAAGRNAALLEEQASKFGVQHVALAEGEWDDAIGSANGHYVGPDSAVRLIDAVAQPGDIVVGAMVGAAGLPATLAAIERGCHIALANKETLVAAGALVMPAVRCRDVMLLPVDSEHSAIFQCLAGDRPASEIRRLVITASGGPFRTWDVQRIQNATIEQALNHPTWNMGRKVTIDSASMMNKALELIEAHWLFGLGADQLEAVVHPQSIVHGLVEYLDGSVLAQLGPPDMRTPIQVALTWPVRYEGSGDRLDLSDLAKLEFEPVNPMRFPVVPLAYDVVRTGGTSGAVFNAANEIAVGAFLNRQISFGRIAEITAEVLQRATIDPVDSLEIVLAADSWARGSARALVSESGSLKRVSNTVRCPSDRTTYATQTE